MGIRHALSATSLITLLLFISLAAGQVMIAAGTSIDIGTATIVVERELVVERLFVPEGGGYVELGNFRLGVSSQGKAMVTLHELSIDRARVSLSADREATYDFTWQVSEPYLSKISGELSKLDVFPYDSGARRLEVRFESTGPVDIGVALGGLSEPVSVSLEGAEMERKTGAEQQGWEVTGSEVSVRVNDVGSHVLLISWGEATATTTQTTPTTTTATTTTIETTTTTTTTQTTETTTPETTIITITPTATKTTTTKPPTTVTTTPSPTLTTTTQTTPTPPAPGPDMTMIGLVVGVIAAAAAAGLFLMRSRRGAGRVRAGL